MRVFFNKMGIERVRFKPAYNPYTEVRLLKFIGPIFLVNLSHLAITGDFCFPSYA